MSYVKQEHFVPKLLLKGFANDDGKLRVYDKENAKWFQSKPGETGTEGEIYDQDVEKWLATSIEGPVSSVFCAVANGRRDLSKEDLVTIGKFITVQRVRVRAIEYYVELNQPDLVSDALKETFHELAGDQGLAIGSELLNQVEGDPKEFLALNGLRNLCNLALRGAMTSGNFELAESMSDMAWRIISPESEFFVISDNPAVVGIPNQVSESPECMLPISSELSLHIGLYGSPGKLNEAIRDDSLVRLLNTRLLAGVRRFIYTPKEEPWISETTKAREVSLPPLKFPAPYIPDTTNAD